MTPAVITLSKPGYMTTHIENAKAFRTAFGQPLLKGFCTGPVLHKGPTELQARLIGEEHAEFQEAVVTYTCLLYTSPSPRDGLLSRMPSSA